MLQEEANIIQQEEREETPTAKQGWHLRINYRLMVQNIPFILFLAALALVYIANSHLAEKKIRRINKLGKEIKELKYQYLNVKSELMFQSKMSEVSKTVEGTGLKELNAPPQKIVVKDEK
ncbi:hypothetical protein LX64_04825 [Chitinophaga skermanii]|uniref:Cell division protein FtsL n=1 Tax=Chitinophaga skermanii TaxID=331697 RepID=A0A327Q357_9BACT|nr:FtsL-like putative cell division protein [Chitinophaga skermanii]RAI98463.1 hypothetical protein LX64_04825 [Chitinophaga skermanii]